MGGRTKSSRSDSSGKVYDAVRLIPPGKVATYGQIACMIGKPGRARMVGRIMSRTPAALRLPCHRVVNSQGRLAPGWDGQRSLLVAEGVLFRNNGLVDMRRCGWDLLL